jgi:plasmid stabilization system protein ParE
MNARYTETALSEVDEILAHIAKDNPLAADGRTIHETIAEPTFQVTQFCAH